MLRERNASSWNLEWEAAAVWRRSLTLLHSAMQDCGPAAPPFKAIQAADIQQPKQGGYTAALGKACIRNMGLRKARTQWCFDL